MGPDGDRTASAKRSRHRLWVLAVCVGLFVGQPVAGIAQTGGGQVPVAQLDPAVREPICQLLRSVQTAVGSFPGVAGIFTALLQAFGCPGAPTGTTTTIVMGTTTTAVPPTTVVGPTSSTSPTTPTTLPLCIPNNPVPTTVQCVTTTTTLPSA